MHDQGVSPHYVHPWLPLKGFKAYRLARSMTARVSFARRDIYQICLVTATDRVCYPENKPEQNGHVLVVASPNAASSWRSSAQGQRGYNCLFTGEFLNQRPRLKGLLQFLLFGLGEVAVYPLTLAQNKSIATLFQQILTAQDSGYAFKHELIMDCLHLLIHEALRMQSTENGYCR